MQTQVSAKDKAMQDPKFLEWLHELTVLGYDQNVTVETDHAECVAFLFLEGKTPGQALPEYIEFRKRWDALNSITPRKPISQPPPIVPFNSIIKFK